MNRRIRKKKEKQQQEMMDNFAAALVELKEAIDAAEQEYWRKYWRKWTEKSARRLAKVVLRQCERRYGSK